jgi:DnaA family protein
MDQLALDLLSNSPPRLENFVPGANGEALALLRRFGDPNGADGAPGERQVHLWGPPGSGKTHLLRALTERLGPAARMIGPLDPPTAYGFSVETEEPVPTTPGLGGTPRVWLVDDVQTLDPACRQALFGLIDRVRDRAGTVLVTAADAPPLGLAIREDLRTRLGWGRVLALKLLTDEDKALALQTLAERRGVSMSREVPAWLLAHSSRDMRALIALFEGLDRYALARQRAITLPLLREYLQRAT